MITLIVCIRRLPALSQEQFTAYWRDRHGPLVLGVPEFTRHMKSYVQYHFDIDSGAAIFGTAAGYDGVALLSFEDKAAMDAAFSEPRYLEIIRPDETQFIDPDNCLSFLASESIMIGRAIAPVAGTRAGGV